MFTKKNTKEAYLFFSDIHLTEPEDHEAVWKPFKNSRHHVDRDLISVIDSFTEDKREFQRNLVLNGDNFDFRMVLSRPDGKQDSHGMVSNTKNAAWKLERILKEHMEFCAKLAEFVEDGYIHIIPGNHDLEFNITSVRRTFRKFLYQLSTKKLSARSFYKRIRFYQNHMYRPGFFYAEHGHHYDPYCTLPEFRSIKKTGELVLPFGDYTSMYLTNRMGHFNPFHDESYLLTTWGYIKVFFRYNLWRTFTSQNLFFTWLFGSIRAFFKSISTGHFLRTRKFKVPTDSTISKDRLQKIRDLYPRNIFFYPGLILRTLWLDRILMGTLIVIFGTSLFFTPYAFFALPLLVAYTFFYNRNRDKADDHGGPSGGEIDKQKIGQRLQSILDTPYIVMGHTHHPQAYPLDDGVIFDLGSWSPYFADIECTKPKYNKRFFLVLARDGADQNFQFKSWQEFSQSQKSPLRKVPQSA